MSFVGDGTAGPTAAADGAGVAGGPEDGIPNFRKRPTASRPTPPTATRTSPLDDFFGTNCRSSSESAAGTELWNGSAAANGSGAFEIFAEAGCVTAAARAAAVAVEGGAAAGNGAGGTDADAVSATVGNGAVTGAGGAGAGGAGAGGAAGATSIIDAESSASTLGAGARRGWVTFAATTAGASGEIPRRADGLAAAGTAATDAEP
jgi:hypothetical protein